MNYFPLDRDPYAAAICLDDKRLHRVFAEGVMVLSKLAHDTGRQGPYLATTPIPNALRRWLVEDMRARQWVVRWVAGMRIALIERGRDVTTYSAYGRYYDLPADLICVDPRAEFADDRDAPTFINLARAVAKGLDYTHVEDAVVAYRQYLSHQWRHVDARSAVWTAHGKPSWF